jgi:hypothetical protein
MKTDMRIVFFGNAGELLLLRIVLVTYGHSGVSWKGERMSKIMSNNQLLTAPHRTAAASTTEYFP